MVQGGNRGFGHHLFRVKYTELNEIFAFMSLRSFALSLVALFIPIHLYRVGYDLRQIALFYALMFATEFFTEFLVVQGIRKFGPKAMITLSVPTLIIHLLLLLTLEQYNWPVVYLALTGGLSLATYWQSYHYDFSKSRHRKKTSTEIGRLYIVIAILGAIAPLVGGLVANSVGIGALYALVVTILFFSVTVLFKDSGKRHRQAKLNLEKVRWPKIYKDLLAYGGDMWEVCSSQHIWPLFLYLIVGSYTKVGGITSVALVITVLVIFFVSKRSDRGKRVDYLRLGGALNGMVAIIRTLVSTVPQAFGISLAKSFTSAAFASPFTSEYYLHADEESRAEYILVMEAANDVAKVIYYLVILSLTFFISTEKVLIVALVMGGVGALLSTLMPPAKCEVCGPIQDKSIRVVPRVGVQK